MQSAYVAWNVAFEIDRAVYSSAPAAHPSIDKAARYLAGVIALRMAFHALRPISASEYSQKGFIFDSI